MILAHGCKFLHRQVTRAVCIVIFHDVLESNSRPQVHFVTRRAFWLVLSGQFIQAILDSHARNLAVAFAFERFHTEITLAIFVGKENVDMTQRLAHVSALTGCRFALAASPTRSARARVGICLDKFAVPGFQAEPAILARFAFAFIFVVGAVCSLETGNTFAFVLVVIHRTLGAVETRGAVARLDFGSAVAARKSGRTNTAVAICAVHTFRFIFAWATATLVCVFFTVVSRCALGARAFVRTKIIFALPAIQTR